MLIARTERDASEPRTRRVPEPGLVTWVTRYFGHEVNGLFAYATIVEMEPNTVGGAHFHSADQFQVVIGGNGFYGKTPVATNSVHFARAFSPYGPIRAGEHGLKWFTLRNGRDSGGIKWMPQSRELLRSGATRPRVIYGEPEIPFIEDGLGAWRFALEPGEGAEGVLPAKGRGQFWIVTAGSGSLAGVQFTEKDSVLFVGPDEAPVNIKAGKDGFNVISLQFPISGS